jgi:hypothetical protein
MGKQGGEWKTVDWQTALEFVARGLTDVVENMARRRSVHSCRLTQRWRSWPPPASCVD